MVACASIGGGLLITGLYQRSKLRLPTPGTITQAEVAIQLDADSSGYRPSVLYDYAVNGVRHTGKRIRFSQRSYARKKRAQEELDRYPVNFSVTFYFDPERPTDAVLAREYPDSVLLIALGIGLLAFAAVISLLVLR